MKIKDAVKVLKEHNKWRRGDTDNQTEPYILGAAIDTIVLYFDKVSYKNKNKYLTDL
jgi:hypothetical protein